MNVPIIWTDGVTKASMNDMAAWEDRQDLPPGSARWVEDASGQIACLRFVCPCGCGGRNTVPIRPGDPWQWDGNESVPTLTPELNPANRCCFYSLTNGVFVA